jgi:hypothetical protein
MINFLHIKILLKINKRINNNSIEIQTKNMNKQFAEKTQMVYKLTIFKTHVDFKPAILLL